MAYTVGMLNEIDMKLNGAKKTWQEIGVHFATLNALVKRDYLCKSLNGKYSITKKGKMFCKIEQLSKGHSFFVLCRKNDTLGMMCSLKGCDILDAWEKPWKWDNEDIFYIQYTNGSTSKILIS